jgi:epoxyqueuosine reductase
MELVNSEMKITNDLVIDEANALGFELVGFSEAVELEKESLLLSEWLQKGFNAGMEYMSCNFEKRKNVKEILPSAKSVISLGINYYSPEEYSLEKNNGKISRYAWGKDYHLVVWQKLDLLTEKLKKNDPFFEAKTYIDTGPVMDKAWAVRSGIGWLGKHTNVINRDIGSWFFIANIITNIELDYSEPITDHCGSCTACLDSCPTKAITAEYVVDANKCISYLTIENKGEIPEEFKGKFDNWIFGCDICQDVCPWNNKFSQTSSEELFYPDNKTKELEIDNILSMKPEEFNLLFKNTPLKRAKLSGLKRNAHFIKE